LAAPRARRQNRRKRAGRDVDLLVQEAVRGFVRAVHWENVVQEMSLKVNTYNMVRREATVMA